MVTQARPIDMADQGLITIDEFERMPEFSGGYELVDGRVVKKPMPGDEHGRIADDLMFAIRNFDKNLRLGRAWRETTVRVRPDERNGRIPDLFYVVASRVPAKSKGSLEVVPDLVVEVWSPSDVDGNVVLNSTRAKMLYWPDSGVKITWCINPKAQNVEILYAGEKTPRKVAGINDMLDGEDVIPGFKIPVADLFA